MVAVFGLNQPRNLRVLASTLKHGDPSFAGALGGVALGIPSYHILELKEEIPSATWAEHMSIEELELEEEALEQIVATMVEVRAS